MKTSGIALVSSNGLGHLRRTTLLLSALNERLAKRISWKIFCTSASWRSAQAWPSVQNLIAAGSRAETDRVPNDHLRWFRDGSGYAGPDTGLLGWNELCASLPELARADFVYSDNLTAPLETRPDAVLGGSFLWSGILTPFQGIPAVRKFIEHEKALLNRSRPKMICVRDLVMPDVLTQTQAIPVGWMCEPPLPQVPEIPDQFRVGILAGKTSAADGELIQAAQILDRTLARQVEWALPVDALELRSQLESKLGRPVSDLDPLRLSGLSGVLGRPGTGSVTECVRWGVPFLAVSEPNNPELAHNGAQIERLKIGLSVDMSSAKELESAIDFWSKTFLSRPIGAQLDREGVKQACDAMIGIWNLKGKV